MTTAQKESWRYAIQHSPPGLLRRLDAGVLAVWVVAQDVHCRAAMKLQEELVSTHYLNVLRKQSLIMLRAAGELGFTPAARVRAYAKTDGAADTEVEPGPGSLRAFLAKAPPSPRIS